MFMNQTVEVKQSSSCTQSAACLSSERHLFSNNKFSYVNLMLHLGPVCVPEKKLLDFYKLGFTNVCP